MKIIVTKKSIYGRDLVYPACDLARGFAALLGVKTFNDGQLKGISSLGYEIEFV